MGYPSETYLKLKFHEHVAVHNTHFSCQLVLKVNTKQGHDTGVLCEKYESDLTTEL